MVKFYTLSMSFNPYPTYQMC